MRKEKILLTPELASSFLMRNFKKNRKVSPSKVSVYATDIIEGNWNPDISEVNDPIAISDKFELLNGQHRCHAVIKAKTPVYTWIYFDVPEELYNYFDNGRPRSVGDFLDVPNSGMIAALARIMYAIQYGDAPLASALQGKLHSSYKNDTLVSRQQIIHIVDEQYDSLRRYTNLAQKMGTHLANKKSHFQVALAIIDYVGFGDSIDRFVDECQAVIPDSPSIIAYRTAFNNGIIKGIKKDMRKWVLSMTFKVYDAFIKGEEIAQFNKVDMWFSKYDKLISDKRKKDSTKEN